MADVFFLIAGLCAIAAAITGGRFGLFRPDVTLIGATDLLGVVATVLIGSAPHLRLPGRRRPGDRRLPGADRGDDDRRRRRRLPAAARIALVSEGALTAALFTAPATSRKPANGGLSRFAPQHTQSAILAARCHGRTWPPRSGYTRRGTAGTWMPCWRSAIRKSPGILTWRRSAAIQFGATTESASTWRPCKWTGSAFVTSRKSSSTLGDKVVAFLHTYARGPGSGVDVEVPVAHVLTFKGGKCMGYVSYHDRAEALTVAGRRNTPIARRLQGLHPRP